MPQYNDGEIVELLEDLNEICNLWLNPEFESLKQELMFDMILGMLTSELTKMPRIAHA